MSIFNFIFGDPNEKELKKLEPVVEEINGLEDRYSDLNDQELAGHTADFRRRLEEKESTIDDLLSEAFALVKEASKRTVGLVHYDEQVIAGIAMHQGKVVEQKTGEGKTLSATLPLYLNALVDSVHLVTVNDYLARRDASWMGPIYQMLGLSVGVIQNEQKSFIYKPKEGEVEAKEEDEEQAVVDVEGLVPCSRKEVYKCDVIYGTNNEFGFDYLRDNMAKSVDDIVQSEPDQPSKKSLHFAIVDEVDSILIDEARTPLIISAPDEKSGSMYQRFAQIVRRLDPKTDYNVDEKDRVVNITDQGIEKIEKILGIDNIYDPNQTKDLGGIAIVHHLEEALKAKALFKKDKDYVVKDGEVVIVDEFTGRMMPGRRYSEGLHQAIEAKEGVEIQRESLTLATISFQNLFRLYDKLSGMTGTAKTEEEEFFKIYGLEVLVVPTHEPLIRKDRSDLVYQNRRGKLKAIVEEIKERNNKGQPILVGTLSIEKSEELSGLLKKKGVKHEILNAKHHQKEAKIIANAGKEGSVTIATNMAGRGVDIALEEEVKELGGLYVLGTERHDARRIDNQLRGRAGRQGDPGESRFFLSLEDDLMRIFGGERIKRIMTTFNLPEDQPIENRMVAKAIKNSQKKVEGINFDIRKHLIEYDDVLNKQREVIYRLRREILNSKEDEKITKAIDLVKEYIDFIVEINSKEGQDVEIKDIVNEVNTALAEEKVKPEELKGKNREEIKKYFEKKIEEIKERRIEQFGKDVFANLCSQIYLRTIDQLWIGHLTLMSELRQGIGLRGYGQQNPLVEYKKEGKEMFIRLMNEIDLKVAGLVFNVQVQLDSESEHNIQTKGAPEALAAGNFSSLKQAQQGNNQPGGDGSGEVETVVNNDQYKDVGRNDPCPCGSGKKFKKCCGG
jgi:preprotein translocase subunit SecA